MANLCAICALLREVGDFADGVTDKLAEIVEQLEGCEVEKRGEKTEKKNEGNK